MQLTGGQSPFLVLMQQGPQATGAVGGVGRAVALLMSPIGLAVTGAAALVGGIALIGNRAASTEGQIRSLTVQAKAFGTEMQASAEQLRGIAKGLYADGLGRDEASAVAGVLATTRGITGTLTKEFATLGSDMAAGIGKGADEAVKSLSAMATDGYPAIKKLQDEIGFLTTDEMKAVRVMAEHGDQSGALATAIAALHRRFDGLRQESMGPAEKAFHDMGVGWNSFIDAVAASRPVMDTIATVSGAVQRMAAAVTSTPKQQVADLEDRAAEVRKSIAMRDAAKSSGETYLNLNLWSLITGATDGADLDRQLAQIEQQLRAARGRVVAEVSKNPIRMAGTSAGAASSGFKPDERSIAYVDEQTAAYDRLAKAVEGNAGQRALNMAAMKAEDEIREKHLSGLEAENIHILRRNEAMLQMGVAAGDELRNLALTAQGHLDLAKAYGISEAAAIRQKAANDALATAAGNAAVNVSELTQANVRAAAGAAAADLAKQATDLARMAELQLRVAHAAGISGAAQQEAQRQVDVYRATAPAIAAAQAAEAQGNFDLAQRLHDLASAYNIASQAKEHADAVTPVQEFPAEFLESEEAMTTVLEVLGRPSSTFMCPNRQSIYCLTPWSIMAKSRWHYAKRNAMSLATASPRFPVVGRPRSRECTGSCFLISPNLTIMLATST
ncbi:hypothetical protein AZL_019050 [Azospirillum sp. B510]|nr:hypothetical protein AZL_019050 [Azospirillum sp. B510]